MLVLEKGGKEFVPSSDGVVGVLDLVHGDLHLPHAVADAEVKANVFNIKGLKQANIVKKKSKFAYFGHLSLGL